MLLDYVREYLARGDEALIRYSDKENEVRLGDEQRELVASSHYFNEVGAEFRQRFNSFPKADSPNVESAIVWSKMKFGLKPVLAINHIMIYKREQDRGPNVLVASKQIS